MIINRIYEHQSSVAVAFFLPGRAEALSSSLYVLGLSPRCRENLSHVQYPVIIFLEKDFTFGLCLNVNVNFCCVGPVSSLTGALHKKFIDIVVLFRNGVIR
jgi:hypothetical protein